VSIPPRARRLRRLSVPTVVVHGAQDPLIPPISGRLAASQIPGARLVVIEGLGHDLGPSAWHYVMDAIIENTRRRLAKRPKRLGVIRALRQPTIHL